MTICLRRKLRAHQLRVLCRIETHKVIMIATPAPTAIEMIAAIFMTCLHFLHDIEA